MFNGGAYNDRKDRVRQLVRLLEKNIGGQLVIRNELSPVDVPTSKVLEHYVSDALGMEEIKALCNSPLEHEIVIQRFASAIMDYSLNNNGISLPSTLKPHQALKIYLLK